MSPALEVLHQHERELVRLRRLLENATTPAVKARLIEEIERREQLVRPDTEAESERTSYS
jgi:hypothetical protein